MSTSTWMWLLSPLSRLCSSTACRSLGRRCSLNALRLAPVFPRDVHDTVEPESCASAAAKLENGESARGELRKHADGRNAPAR